MIPRRVLVLAVAVLAVLAAAATSAAQAQEHAEHPQPSAEEQAMMAAWQKSMTPGEPHQRLAESAGEWKMQVTMWMEPGAEPTVAEAKATRTMILGGRHLLEEVEGTFMGAPFHGRSLTGYDNVTGKYWSTWVDNQSTGLMESTGTWDEEQNALVMEGTYSDPMTGARKPFRSILRRPSADREVYESWESMGGQEVKTMEVVSTRQ